MLLSIVSNIGYIYLLIIAFFFQTFFQQFSQSLGKIKVYAITGIVLTLSTAFFSFILIPKYGLEGFFTAQIFSLLIAAGYSLIRSGSYKYFSKNSINVNRYYEMIRYSVPLIPNAIMWWLVASLNRPLMEQYIGIYAIGIFAVANKIPSLINVLFSVFMVSWQISVIEEFKKVDFEKFYNKVLKSVFTFLAAFVIILSVFGRPLIQFIIDPKFTAAYKYIPILCFSVLFSSISSFVGANFLASRKSKYFFYSSVFGAVIALIFNFLLIPLFDLYGVVFAILLSHFAMMFSRVIYSWKVVKISNILYYILMLSICFGIVLSLTFIEDSRITTFIIISGSVLFIFLAKKEFVKDLIQLKKLITKAKISN